LTSGDIIEGQGKELKVFANATHWKSYWADRIRAWVGGEVLEVGAGLGANMRYLQNSKVQCWHCLEPDPELNAELAKSVAHLPACRVMAGTLASVPPDLSFDSILYIDVLEHIEKDRQEAANAANLLRPGGYLIVLSPAHQFLFSPFDAAIGHYRRYNRQSLRACSPPNCRLVSMFYLDCIGMAASLGNRMMLRQDFPSVAQIKIWDRYMVPVSRVLDPVLGYNLGKTIVGVWQRS
jgi:SAM-dependent methyltransferase